MSFYLPFPLPATNPLAGRLTKEGNSIMIYFLRFLVFLFGFILRPFHKKWKPGEPIRCLVVGYGGANNTGAEARTDEALKQMLAADDRLHITITALDRERMLRYTKEHERLKVRQIHMTFVFSILRLVLRSDMLVLIEGSCFKENFSQALFWFFMYSADLAQRFGLPTVTYGVDAGWLRPANKAWGAKVAERIDLLMTRTEAAKRVLKDDMGVDNDIVVTTDTAFTIEPEPSTWAREELARQGCDLAKPTIGIAFEELFWWPVIPSFWRYLTGQKKDRYKSIYYHTWPNDGAERSKKMKEAVANFARWAGQKFDASIVFFAMERLDADPCRDVMKMLRVPTVLFDSDHYNARQMTALLRELTMLVTCRYHALVLSMGGGVPVIGLAHDERIATIMDEVGLKENYFIDYKESKIEEKLKNMSSELMNEKDVIKKCILDAVPTYLSRMAENEKHFAKLVNEKFSG